MPKMSHRTRMSIQTWKNHSFQTNGPVLFNLLPKAIRNMKKCTEEEFKEKLDTYLQKVPDKPGGQALKLHPVPAGHRVVWEEARGLREESRE